MRTVAGIITRDVAPAQFAHAARSLAMWRRELLHRLAEYASALRDGLDICRTDDQRRHWTAALAFVGVLLAAINDDAPLGEIRALVQEEDDRFSFDYLTLDAGKVAEEAWSNFRDSLAASRV